MLPISEKNVSARKRDEARFKDEKLKRGLACQDYLILDGAMGSMLQALDVDTSDKIPDMLCLDSPKIITDIHRQYVDAGAQVITTNTFGANAHKLPTSTNPNDVFAAAVACARKAGAPYVAADIGPIGELFEPMGDLVFDTAYELFAQQARAAQSAGCDLFIIETMADLLEIKAAVLAVKENSDLPIMATMTFGEDGHTLMGTTPQIAALTLDALGVNALGVNCSVGPQAFAPFIAQMRKNSACALVAQPNAGLPEVIDGKTTYAIDVESFIEADIASIDAGATILGSCCGTTPQYTSALCKLVADKSPQMPSAPGTNFATSPRLAVDLDALDLLHEVKHLNEDGESDTDDFTDTIFDAADEGVKLLALRVDGIALADIAQIIVDIQSLTAIPLWFIGCDIARLEAAVRVYAGRPVVGEPGKKSSRALAELALHYGVAVVA